MARARKAARHARSKARRRGRPEEAKPAEAPTLLARATPHLVAAFVLFHVIASCIYTIPNLGSGLDRRAWRDARAQRELGAWADRFGMEPADFEERIYGVAVGFQETRSAIARPFRPYMRATGVQQSWAMFSAGTVLSDRFGVRMRRCPAGDARCEWEPLFLHGDDELTWRRAVIGHPRLRSAIFRWSWPSYAGRYQHGCRAIAGLVFADFPDAVAAECGFERSTTRSPRDPSPPPPVWGRTIVVSR